MAGALAPPTVCLWVNGPHRAPLGTATSNGLSLENHRAQQHYLFHLWSVTTCLPFSFSFLKISKSEPPTQPKIQNFYGSLHPSSKSHHPKFYAHYSLPFTVCSFISRICVVIRWRVIYYTHIVMVEWVIIVYKIVELARHWVIQKSIRCPRIQFLSKPSSSPSRLFYSSSECILPNFNLSSL